MAEAKLFEQQRSLLLNVQSALSRHFEAKAHASLTLEREQEQADDLIRNTDQTAEAIARQGYDAEWAARYILELADYKTQIQGLNSQSIRRHLQVTSGGSYLDKAKRHASAAQASLEQLKKEVGESSPLRTVFSEEDGTRYLSVDGTVKKRIGWGTGCWWAFFTGIGWTIFISVSPIGQIQVEDISGGIVPLAYLIVYTLWLAPPIWLGRYKVKNGNKSRLGHYADVVKNVAYVDAYLSAHYEEAKIKYQQAALQRQNDHNQQVSASRFQMIDNLNSLKPDLVSVTNGIDRWAAPWGDEFWQTWTPDVKMQRESQTKPE